MIVSSQPASNQSTSKNEEDFLTLLQAQAAKQSRLEKNRFFPQKFDVLTSFVGRYPWQVIITLSCISSLIVTYLS